MLLQGGNTGMGRPVGYSPASQWILPEGDLSRYQSTINNMVPIGLNCNAVIRVFLSKKNAVSTIDV